MKKQYPRHDGKLSMVRYMMNTQPSCEAASYTVKKLVASSSKPLKPRSLRDSSSGMHTIFRGHWYPASGRGEQYVSGIAKSFTLTFLDTNTLLINTSHRVNVTSRKCQQVEYYFSLLLKPWIGSISNAMMFQFTKKLDTKNAIQWHEKQKKCRYITDLNAWTPVKTKLTKTITMNISITKFDYYLISINI